MKGKERKGNERKGKERKDVGRDVGTRKRNYVILSLIETNVKIFFAGQFHRLNIICKMRKEVMA